MNTDTREIRSAESYATFWEPAPTPPAPARKPADARDAYLEFVNITEAEATALRVERAA